MAKLIAFQSFFYVLPRQTSIIAGKEFNLFDECAARWPK